MSECAEMFSCHAELRKLLRARYGKPCPECVRLLPKAHPTILLPRQRCRIHKYHDLRPELTQADYDALSEKGGAA